MESDSPEVEARQQSESPVPFMPVASHLSNGIIMF